MNSNLFLNIASKLYLEKEITDNSYFSHSFFFYKN